MHREGQGNFVICPRGLSSRCIAATVLSLVWLLVGKCVKASVPVGVLRH